MKLRDYLRSRGESEAAFAKRAGVPQRTINRVCRGAGCHAATALAIVRATHKKPTPGGGTVSLEDLAGDESGAAA